MTLEEAIEYLELLVQEQYEEPVPFTNPDKDAEMLGIVRAALEKQLPKKSTKSDSGMYHICPCCEMYINANDELPHCPRCGQKLDWDKE